MHAPSQDSAQAAFRAAQECWREALETHRLAPPDADFSARLSALSAAAHAEAEACRSAAAAGFAWPPHRSVSSQPPYELRPDSGRRGPEGLWQRFDRAVTQLNRVAAGTELLAVADAYEQLANAASELAETTEREDLASGLLRSRQARGAA